ncbi:uncharacterized protein EI90DRAFT_2829494, partial [Cantharellus anzutake]|uniref:uncharacterized protein n=1 Tax=Cantharellus anzutake TaxID=1750568 RepID=UPI001907247B
HHMLIALKCAVSNRPFVSSEDEFYRMEVEHLRPGTTPPSRKTVSEDIKTIH